MFDATKNDFNESVEEVTEMLKTLFKTVFVPGSSLRGLIVPLLEHHGDVICENDPDSMAVTKQILHVILKTLATSGFMSFLDSAIIEEMFKKDPKKIDSIVDKIIITLRSNVVTMCGGYVGSFLASLVGDYVMWNYCPLFSKQA